MKPFALKGLRKTNGLLFGLLLTSFASTALAQVEVKVEDPWVRATVPSQPATGAFMRLTASEDVKLVRVSSPVAAKTELHEMTMKDGVMTMKPLPSLQLPANQPVTLDTHGYHIMLINPKEQIKEGATVSLTLTVVDDAGNETSVKVDAPVRPLASGEDDLPD
ncbi:MULTISPECIES: copper chaperone PCu(A)C [Pseudomonas]|uniref:copper chaperone PCu(A)C n=1 Tax=Pseudomonas TaxID=286 RepID=UPI0009F632DA|nr:MULTISPECIES: copper chaperone PCu(A)C [Pseudomonas]PTV61225.1 copper chaperone PCu(A)C [Pseudomonas putida]